MHGNMNVKIGIIVITLFSVLLLLLLRWWYQYGGFTGYSLKWILFIGYRFEQLFSCFRYLERNKLLILYVMHLNAPSPTS